MDSIISLLQIAFLVGVPAALAIAAIVARGCARAEREEAITSRLARYAGRGR